MESFKEEFLEILQNYQGILHKVCLIYFKNHSEREENFQEIIYQLWRSFPKIKNKNSIGSWIYSVSINTSISRIKKTSQIEYTEQLPEITDPSNTYEQIINNESYQILINAIHLLNEIDKTIMFLYLEERSYSEIAEIIGITQSNVGIRINRAKKILKKHLT